jgi:hypothetical protein
MKICRKRQDSQEFFRSTCSENCYLACCFAVPIFTALCAIIVDILYSQIAILVLQVADLVLIAGLILLLNRRTHYAEDVPQRIARAFSKGSDEETPSLSSMVYITGPIPRTDVDTIKTYYFPMNGKIVKVKYCYTCRKFKPPLAVHCSKCRECCLQFDHHCSWLKTCIARHNYATFIFFLVALLLEGVIVFLTALFGWTSDSPYRTAACVLMVLAYIGATLVTGFVLVLLGFHVFLMSKGKSTYQFIKGRFRMQVLSTPTLEERPISLEKVTE